MKRVMFRGILKNTGRVRYGGCSACGQTRVNSSSGMEFLDEYHMMFEGRQFTFRAGHTYEVADNLAEFLLAKYSYRQGEKIPAFTLAEDAIERDEETGKEGVFNEKPEWAETLPAYYQTQDDKTYKILWTDNKTFFSKDDADIQFPERYETIAAIAKAVKLGELQLDDKGLVYLDVDGVREYETSEQHDHLSDVIAKHSYEAAI